MLKKPEGSYCFERHKTHESIKCPYFNRSNLWKPRCSKYNTNLRWIMADKVEKLRICKEDTESNTSNKSLEMLPLLIKKNIYH